MSDKSEFAWLIEAPGPCYLGARKLGGYSFYWSANHNDALRFYTKEQADLTMMALRQLISPLFAFEVNLGNAQAIEHGWSMAADPADAKLMPCPFCGSTACITYDSSDGAAVECSNDDCEVHPRFQTFHGTEDDAERAWNTRPQAAPEGEPDLLKRVAVAICKSGKFETGQGTCAAICMDQLGSARRGPCQHALSIHLELAANIVNACGLAAQPKPLDDDERAMLKAEIVMEGTNRRAAEARVAELEAVIAESALIGDGGRKSEIIAEAVANHAARELEQK